jgi:uncharacterized protein (PEP-CTERM system associated)
MGGRRWHKAATATLFLACLLNATAAPAEWTIEPQISLRAAYSEPNGLTDLPADGAFTARISPSLRVVGGGSRFRANLLYAPSAVFGRHDRLVNTLAGNANLEAVENFFFIDALGSVSQTFISPFEPQPDDILLNTENRLETRTWGFSPYVRGQVRGAFTYELRNRNTWTHADNRALADVRTTQWSGRAASPISRFGWALEYDDTVTRYETLAGAQVDRESRLYRGRIFFQPDVSLQLRASAGGEENNYALQQTRSYEIYGAGVLFRPGPRTSLDLEWEQRFFGPSRFARLSHRMRLTALNFNYSRNVGSFQQDLLTLPPGNTAAILDAIFAARIPDPIERQAAVEEFLRVTGTPAFLATPLSFYTQQVVLRERADASAAILGKRNSVIFTVFTSKSTDLQAGIGAGGQDTFLFGGSVRQTGFALRGNHSLTASTTLGAGATRTYSKQEEPIQRDSRNDHYNLSLNHALSPKTTTMAGVSLTHFESNTGTSRDARSVFVGMTHRF